MASLRPLARLMDQLAVRTALSLSEAFDLEMDWGEVTVTHTNLLAIARHVKEQRLTFHIERITQKRERSLGADWEFWLQLPSGEALGYSIQAKRLYLNGVQLEYSELGHRGELPHEKQYDTLIRHAETVGAHPFHVFYNARSLGVHTLALPPHRGTLIYGCSAVSTYDVRSVRNRFAYKGMNRAHRYIPYSMPWSDLFRIGGDGIGRTAGGGGPAPSAKYVSRHAAKATPDGLEALSDGLRHQSAAASPKLVPQLPDYILQAQSKAEDAHLPDDDALPEFAVVVKAFTG